MKGFFLAVLLISLLIVGVLVVKNLGEQKSADQPGKMEATQKAEKAVEEVREKFDAFKKKAKQAE